MEDFNILEAVERYIAGEMSPDERVYFESLRKSNPEIDQAVVEHTYFLQQMHRYEDTRQFKAILNDTHIHLAEAGQIDSPRLQGRAKVVYLFNRYKRTAAIAASIAGITVLCVSAMVWSLYPARTKEVKSELEMLKGKFESQEQTVQILKDEINTVKNAQGDSAREEQPKIINYTSGGTGFLVDAKGYLVTNAHVVENAKFIAVQNAGGKDLRAEVVFKDATRDIAILKIVDKAFKTPASIPYSIKKSSGDIAEPIFSLGYPRKDIVYGEGYLAARTGYKGDTLAVQISINANSGNSGSPIINRKGEIIGVLNARQTTAEGTVFAVQSKYIYEALSQLQKNDTSFKNVRLPSSSNLKGIDRTKQVEKITDYVYMVKVR
ncbi:MAG TPA: trypsin-like peptidase domain-containing protein [Flavisolibacter sp.]|nr:trypsin-like peptidase domain-containing protein [Flavisolibacter sp.]